tara:strand:- start:2847 stop:4094 length:1248 start_codon:yes stop_codon:yes gene_type:complete
MTIYNNPLTGQTISPASVSYSSLTISVNTALVWPINGNLTSSTPVSSILDITASATGLQLQLPAATQVSVGESILVRNTGTNTFTVTDTTGTATIVSVSSGISQFIFLTNNSTTSGTWSTVVLGASVSSANSAALAGSGLLAIGTTLNQSIQLTSYFSNTTLTAALRSQFAVWSGGVGTITLPNSTSVGNNWFAIIRNNGTGVLTLTPNGSDTIDGNSNQQLQLTESLVIVANGTTGFNTYAYGRSNQFAYTQFATTVTGGTLTLTSTQAANTIQSYSGTLTSNQNIVVPSTVQLYTVTNSTSGSFNLIVKTAISGGATVTVQQGTTLVLVSDGTNVFNAASGSSSSVTSLTVGNGTLAVPSLKFSGDLNSGLYLPSTSNMTMVISNTAIANFSSSGLSVTGTVTASGGVSGGSF